MPELFGIGIPVAEVIAPILVLLGIFTRISGLIIALCILFTLLLLDWSNLLAVDPQVGNLVIDRNLLYLFGGLTLFFSGGGKYAIYKTKNDWLK